MSLNSQFHGEFFYFDFSGWRCQSFSDAIKFPLNLTKSCLSTCMQCGLWFWFGSNSNFFWKRTFFIASVRFIKHLNFILACFWSFGKLFLDFRFCCFPFFNSWKRSNLKFKEKNIRIFNWRPFSFLLELHKISFINGKWLGLPPIVKIKYSKKKKKSIKKSDH